MRSSPMRTLRLLGPVLAAAISLGAVAWAEPAPAPDADASAGAVILQMAPGEIRTLPVKELHRAAVGDPAIVDVTVISPTELMVQAKRAGASTLLYWDEAGSHTARVEVAANSPGAVEDKINRIVTELRYPSVRVKRDGDTVYLVGEVANPEEEARLAVALSAFSKDQRIVNLVAVTPAAPAPPEAIAPLISLSVQVLELNRSDLERLGVKWSDSLSLTEQAVQDFTAHNALFWWGTSLNRSSLQATINALVEKKRARLLAEPKLVTASGKQASSFIGVEVPIINATSVGTGGSSSVNASIDFRQTGVVLKMTPTVVRDDQIKTIVEAEVSSVDSSVGLNIPVGTQTILVPGFSVRRASTELTAASGETLLIAGLLQAEDTKTVSQVPALGSMPVIGRLFKSPEVKTTERELVIAVTPELMVDKADESDRRLAVEQALASAEVVASVEDPRLRYALAVQDRIARALHYPAREKETGMAGTVKLRLHLFADGTLGRVMVSKSSGIEALDAEAQKIAESQAPYPKFPSQLSARELWLELPVVFRP